MKVKLTIQNRPGLSKEIISLFIHLNAEVNKLEILKGQMFIEADDLEKHVERDLASKLMQIEGVKWVENTVSLPSNERNVLLESLLNSIKYPVIGINNKGIIIYQNKKSNTLFKQEKGKVGHLKKLFTEADWASKIDVAASSDLPVSIHSIAGPMLVDVLALNQNNKNIGAVLIFQNPEDNKKNTCILENAKAAVFDDFVTQNKEMKDTINRARHMSHSSVPMIIYGETGVGKQDLAQAIHFSGPRKNKILTHLSCSKENPLQTEIELFGLSDSLDPQTGLLEISKDGTVYIENIQDMSKSCQKKLLIYIQTKTFTRFNGSTSFESSSAIIASSSISLDKNVRNKTFIQELFYALDISQLKIPPLRDRKDDIDALVVDFLVKFNNAKHGIMGLSFEALNKVKSYFWPGNVRQLKNLLYQASLAAQGNTIEASDMDIEGHIHVDLSFEDHNLPKAVAEFEKHFVHYWYQKFPSTRKLAAHLGVSHTTIAQKLNKYNISEVKN